MRGSYLNFVEVLVKGCFLFILNEQSPIADGGFRNHENKNNESEIR